jgi:hypothetical protein
VTVVHSPFLRSGARCVMAVISDSYHELGYDLSRRRCDVDGAFLDGEVIAADETGRFALKRGAVSHRITNRTLLAIRRRGSVS